jgi:hypothetical protein
MKYDKNVLTELAGGHPIITWAAMQALPDWQREVWQDHQYNLAQRYSLYGDLYFGCKEEVGPYMEYPDGTVPPMGEIGELRYHNHVAHAVDFWECPFWEEQEKEFTYFLDRIAASLAAGDVLAAAKFAGTIAHHIEDSGVPAHAIEHGDLEYIKDLLPAPDKYVSFQLHSYSEASPPPFLISDYKPRLYGRTPREAGTNYIQRYVELVRYARTLMIPMAMCAFGEKHEEAAQIRLKAARMCAFACADYMYTATCIGMNRFDKDPSEALRTVPLTDAWPFRSSAWAPAPYLHTGPLHLRGINLDAKGNPVPCEVLVKEPEGKTVSRRFKEALGAGAYYEYHYRLPAGLYQRFTAMVGIHAVLKAMRSINVEVKVDSKTAWSDVLKPGEPARTIDLPIHGARDIQLISSGPFYRDPDGSNNHVVWVMPRVMM